MKITKIIKLISPYVLFAIILIKFTSCSNFNSDANIERISVEGSNVKDTVDVSNLIEDINIIKLNERSGSIIGEATKVFKTKKNYIVFDKINAKRIVVFDSNGQFVKNITDQLPNGIPEIVQLNDCWLTDVGDLEVYDFAQKYIYRFNGGDFSFKKLIKTSESVIFYSLIRLPRTENYVGYKGYTSYNKLYHGSQYKLAILDSALNIQKTDLKYPKALNGVMVTTTILAFTHFQDTIRFAQDFDPFIYTVTPDGISKRYKIEYTYRPFPLDFEDKIVTPNLRIFKKANPDFGKINSFYNQYTRFNGPWLETNSYAFFSSYDTKGKLFYSIYGKKDHRVISQAHALKENARFKMVLPFFTTTDVAENEFITVWPGFALKRFMSKDSPLLSIIDKDLEANYLVKVKLK